MGIVIGVRLACVLALALGAHACSSDGESGSGTPAEDAGTEASLDAAADAGNDVDSDAPFDCGGILDRHAMRPAHHLLRRISDQRLFPAGR